MSVLLALPRTEERHGPGHPLGGRIMAIETPAGKLLPPHKQILGIAVIALLVFVGVEATGLMGPLVRWTGAVFGKVKGLVAGLLPKKS